MVSVVAAAVIDRAEERWRTIRLAPAKINDAVKTKKANREIKRLVERRGEESLSSVILIVGIVGIVNSSAALFERVPPDCQRGKMSHQVELVTGVKRAVGSGENE